MLHTKIKKNLKIYVYICISMIIKNNKKKKFLIINRKNK